MIVYKFGLLAPIENADVVREQMRLAHRYRNALVEIERGRRAAHRALLSSVGDMPALEATHAQADAIVRAAREEGKRERSKSRSRAISAEVKSCINAAKNEAKATRSALFEARRRLRDDPRITNERERIDDTARALVRNAREHCGVYWGTYLLSEDAMQASAKMPLYDGAEPNDPRFVPWRGEGRVQVQIQAQAGKPSFRVSDAHRETDTRLRIAPVDLEKDTRGERRRAARTSLRMRVASDGTSPIWATWPMIMHREMAGVIKRVVVSLRLVGNREVWSVEVYVDNGEIVPAARDGVVAVDLGWRAGRKALRVAMILGSDGETVEVFISPEVEAQIRKCEEIRRVRDTGFNAARDVLTAWIDAHEVPARIRDATSHLMQWRSCARLAALARRWKTSRFDGDTEAYEALEAWRYHDEHLWNWECSQRRKALLHRRETYRVLAARLAKRYGTLVLEDFNLREVAVVPPVEAGPVEGLERNGDGSRPVPAQQDKIARSNRHLSSTSELRLVLVNAFRSRGGYVDRVLAEDTTQACCVCGTIQDFDAAKYLRWTCTECGSRKDQDTNADFNLLAWWREQSGDDSTTGTARGVTPAEKKGKRWEKVRRQRDEKKTGKGPLANRGASDENDRAAE